MDSPCRRPGRLHRFFDGGEQAPRRLVDLLHFAEASMGRILRWLAMALLVFLFSSFVLAESRASRAAAPVARGGI